MTRWWRLPPPPDDPEEEHDEWDGDEPVVVPITEAFDLHDFPPREVVPVAEAYLEAAREKGYTEVRLIHGRGKGVQRANLRRMLGRHPDVEGFEDAPAERGGWGATLVRLRPRDEG